MVGRNLADFWSLSSASAYRKTSGRSRILVQAGSRVQEGMIHVLLAAETRVTVTSQNTIIEMTECLLRAWIMRYAYSHWYHTLTVCGIPVFGYFILPVGPRCCKAYRKHMIPTCSGRSRGFYPKFLRYSLQTRKITIGRCSLDPRALPACAPVLVVWAMFEV